MATNEEAQNLEHIVETDGDFKYTSKEKSLKELSEDHQARFKQWTNVDSKSQLILEAHFGKGLGWFANCEITQCVCVALGNFTPYGVEFESKEDFDANGRLNMEQLIFLENLLAPLKKTHNALRNSKNINFQDPLFNSSEKRFLESLGYSVLDHPKAFDMMTDTTFVFAPLLDLETDIQIFRKSRPSLYIGRKLNYGELFKNDDSATGDEEVVLKAYTDTAGDKEMLVFGATTRARGSFSAETNLAGKGGLENFHIYWQDKKNELSGGSGRGGKP